VPTIILAGLAFAGQVRRFRSRLFIGGRLARENPEAASGMVERVVEHCHASPLSNGLPLVSCVIFTHDPLDVARSSV